MSHPACPSQIPQEKVLDGGYLPHAVIRIGIRRQLAQRVAEIAQTSVEEAYKSKMKYLQLLRTRPMAVETAKANEQHYEVGTGVLQACLGPRMKYSCCLYPGGNETLGQAEVDMLKLYVERAGLKDGMRVLDLGYVTPVIPHFRVSMSKLLEPIYDVDV